MEITAKTRTIRIAPRKARLVIGLVRGKKFDLAIEELSELPKKSSGVVIKLLNSAKANAKNNHNIDSSDLFIERAFVDQGPTLKRWRPRAFGRAAAIRKKTSHITIVLSKKEELSKPKFSDKKEEQSKPKTSKNFEPKNNNKKIKESSKVKASTKELKDS